MNPPLEILRSTAFERWFDDLRDKQARLRVLARIDRLSFGNPGDARAVGAGVSELRIDHGPGYRVYFTRRGFTAVVLLCGGNKHTQSSDIEQAKAIAGDLRG